LIEAVAEVLDFISRAADLDRFQAALADALNTLMKQTKGTRQNAGRHSRESCGDEQDDEQ
jgi:hypothetical protein